jgi:hypothetical protein
VAKAGDRVTILRDPQDAVRGAHLVSTDVWTSMGQEEETAKRLKLFAPFQVNRALLDLAANDVLFMHCLPAHRGEEISLDLLDDPRSVAWDQAENRLHAQKALLEFLVAPSCQPRMSHPLLLNLRNLACGYRRPTCGAGSQSAPQRWRHRLLAGFVRMRQDHNAARHRRL